MNDTETTASQDNFWAYLVDTILSDPRTKAMIGCGVRWFLHAVGVALAAYPVGHLLQGVSSNADWIMLAAGAILSLSQLVWGIYQKWRVNRKVTHLQQQVVDARATTEQIVALCRDLPTAPTAGPGDRMHEIGLSPEHLGLPTKQEIKP